MKYLLLHKANLNTQDVYGQTALMHASSQEHAGTVRLLLQNSVNPNAQDICGQTVLIQSSNQGHEGIVELLLQNSAYPDTQNIYGLTALNYAKTYSIAQKLKQATRNRQTMTQPKYSSLQYLPVITQPISMLTI